MESVDEVAFGTSCFSIVTTVIALVVFIVVLIGVVRKKREPKGSKLFWPYLLLILMLVALLVANNRTEYEKHSEISMQSTVDETNLILKNAQKRIEEVDMDELSKQVTDKWFAEKFQPAELLLDSKKKINFDGTKTKIDKFLEHVKRDIDRCMKHRAYLLYQDRGAIKKACLYKNEYILDEIAESDKILINILEDQFKINNIMKGRIDEVCADIQSDVDAMKDKDFGAEKIKEDLNKRKAMLLTFQSTVDNTETVRKQWVDKYVEALPDKQSILKTVIIRTTLALMLLLSVTLVIMITSKYVPQIVLSIGMSFMVVTTGIMTIGLCGYTINLYYQFQATCPLNNDNFGFLNFTSSIPENDRMCQTPNGTFFESLTSEMLSFPNIIRDYNIQENIDKTRKKATDVMQPFVFPRKQFESYFGPMSVKTDVIFQSAHDRYPLKCYARKEMVETAEKFRDDRNNYTTTMSFCHRVLEEYNEYVATFPDVLMEIFQKPYKSVLASYTRAVDRIQQQTNATEFSCQVFFDKYSNAGDTICRPFDGQVALLWIYLIVIILSFTASIFVHILVLRNLKSGKKSGASDEQQAPSPSPTSTPPPQTKSQIV